MTASGAFASLEKLMWIEGLHAAVARSAPSSKADIIAVAEQIRQRHATLHIHFANAGLGPRHSRAARQMATSEGVVATT